MADNHAGANATKRVLVIGGGLAGITTAIDLADRGCQVTLLERRPYLGGRTYSFVDKESGEEVDNGQHIYMKCCTAYIGLLEKLGVASRTSVQRRMRVPVMDAKRRLSRLASSPLPAPLHLLPSFATYRHLTWRDKRAAAKAILAMRKLSFDQRRALDDVTFADWLKRYGQSDATIARFWDLIVIPTLNDPSKRVSASQAIMVFQEGFFRDAHGADVGISKVGLSTLLMKEAQQYIESRGGTVMLGKSLERLEGSLEGIDRARLYSEPPIVADAYVLAVPPRLLRKLLPDGLAKHEFFERGSRLAMSPIVNLHLWFDRRVADFGDFIALLDNEAQYVFDKTPFILPFGSAQGRLSAQDERHPNGGQRLCLSLSAAHKYIDMTNEELVPLMVGELAKAFPAVKGATLTRSIVVRERYATFSPRPGSGKYRLPSRTPVPNLYLAGEWTDTDWPSTMESAVRSGHNAARALLGEN
ncbi:MAG: FAD-dependent oxidoreductase [Chloroflexi bacterium]|nr:FAD-dependent oxidoreductase [Chloroflexota bacterium]